MSGQNADFICGHLMQYKCSPPRVKWLSNLYDLSLCVNAVIENYVIPVHKHFFVYITSEHLSSI
jgi:hypothetical protein